ncbi:hypothetical protein EWH99_13445 [Sporolactobacillus sp. THM7-7]|nr:hypothetical protein EWH99_13445 [Sporolactobacillus sp. THM7-7]
MGTELNEVGYFAHAVTKKLGMTGSKLRRLSQALERYGYVFTRNERNHRIYFHKDIQAVTKLQEQMNRGRKIEDAAQTVCGEAGVEKKIALPIHETDDPDALLPAESREKDLSITARQLRLMVEEVAVTTAEKTASRVVEKYNRGVERVIEQRDKELVTRLREAHVAVRERNQKGFFSRLFSRS